MNPVEHRIQQLVRGAESQRELLDKLLAEYEEDIAKRNIRLEAAKEKVQAGPNAVELEAYYLLAQELKTASPLKLLLRMLQARELPLGGWLVPSSNGDALYRIGADINDCDCPYFQNSGGRSCGHMDAIRLLIRIKFGKAEQVTST